MKGKLLAVMLAIGASSGCGPAASPKPEAPLELPRTVDLAPAAGLTSLVEAHPRELLAHAELLPLVAQVLPDEQFQVFQKRHGGVDPRQLEDLVVASYGSITLVLARGDFDPARLEHAFSERTTRVTGRFVDRRGGPVSTIVRLEGTTVGTSPNATEEHAELLLLGRQAIAFEERTKTIGVGPLRVSELFALGKLQRARPALAAEPLDAAARAIGDAPVRIFFPGPFEGEMAKGLGGLLRVATAVAIAVRPSAQLAQSATPALDVTIALLGGWNADAQAAGERFAATVSSMSRSDLGHLCGVHEPIRGPDLQVGPTVLTLRLTIDARRLASGARAATGAQIEEIMKD